MKNKNIPIFVLFLIVFLFFTEATANADQQSQLQSNKISVAVENYSETIPESMLNDWTKNKTSLSLSPSMLSEIENTSYCPKDGYFCELTLSTKEKQKIKLLSQTTIDQSSIKKYLEDLARKVNREPADAKFTITDGKVSTFSEAQNGIILNEAKGLEVIVSAIENSKTPTEQTIQLPFDSKKPEINYADVNNLGISSLIGEGTSNFKGSPANRIHNIKVATQRFNGVLIKPGEEFSFVSILGEVDGDHGYLPELVIKNNTTEPEFGGGICQVSSTAFRAAIYSGLKITARKNHAYPVSYYAPQGMDSTVYLPRPDLKFVNNTPNHILIQTKIVGTQLVFDFYGTDDGRKTTVDGPHVIEKQPDGALKTTFTQHVINKDGQEFITDIFNSSYNSPYKYPHPGGPVLSVKPSNWTEEEWKNYKKTIKDMQKIAQKAKI
jgi:vancomycin resistance protein YoaR